MDQMGDHMKINFDYIQIQIWILQTVRAENKMGIIVFSFSVFFSSYGL